MRFRLACEIHWKIIPINRTTIDYS